MFMRMSVIKIEMGTFQFFLDDELTLLIYK